MSRRFLVVGCGSIGRRHLRNLRTLDAGELLAWDPVPARAAAANEETRAVPVDSLQAALEAGVDACLICSPTSLHAEQAIQAAAFTHLFIEKPIAVAYADALAVADAVEANRRACFVACNLRFHPGIAALKRALDTGAIGGPLAIRAEFGQYLPDWHPWEDYRKGYSASRDLGGGVLLDAIHELDLVRWLCGEYAEVRGVRGRTGTLEIDTEDISLLSGRLESGVWFDIHLDYLQRTYSRSCKVIGAEGTLLWDCPTGLTSQTSRTGQTATLCDFRNMNANAMYLGEMRHFLDCLDGGDSPAQDARAAAAIVGAAQKVEWLP